MNALSNQKRTEPCMSLGDLELRGVKLPEKETCLNDLTANQIVEKINAFHQRLRRESYLQVAPFAEAYFLNLIALYPLSMCSKTMTDELKLVAALFFFGSQPTHDAESKPTDQELRDLFPRNRPSPAHSGYTLEDLALIFDRTRPAIAEAIRQKQEQAQVMLEEAVLRCQHQQAIANENVDSLEKLSEDEKIELFQEKKKVEEKNRTSLPC
jgi:hypothetical protein